MSVDTLSIQYSIFSFLSLSSIAGNHIRIDRHRPHRQSVTFYISFDGIQFMASYALWWVNEIVSHWNIPFWSQLNIWINKMIFSFVFHAQHRQLTIVTLIEYKQHRHAAASPQPIYWLQPHHNVLTSYVIHRWGGRYQIHYTQTLSKFKTDRFGRTRNRLVSWTQQTNNKFCRYAQYRGKWAIRSNVGRHITHSQIVKNAFRFRIWIVSVFFWFWFFFSYRNSQSKCNVIQRVWNVHVYYIWVQFFAFFSCCRWIIYAAEDWKRETVPLELAYKWISLAEIKFRIPKWFFEWFVWWLVAFVNCLRSFQLQAFALTSVSFAVAIGGTCECVSESWMECVM